METSSGASAGVGGGLPPFPRWARVSASRRDHVRRVGALVAAWANEMNLGARDRERWLRAVILHDALKDAPDPQLAELSDDRWDVPALRHGPAAAVLAERAGEHDRGVLDAVRYHSVGYRAWDRAGQILYLADYLEPGRSYKVEQREALVARVPQDLEGVLRTVAQQRIHAVIAAGMGLLVETVDFWNGLVCESSHR